MSNPHRNDIDILPAKELKLYRLLKGGLVLVGDVWQYSYDAFGHQVNAVTTVSLLTKTRIIMVGVSNNIW